MSVKDLVLWSRSEFSMTDKRDAALAGLRGLAVLLVLLSHLGLAKIKTFGLVDFSGIGKSGVVLFFVLSAYLLTGRFLSLNRYGVRNFIRFIFVYMQRRILRIYPLYLVVIAVFMLLSGISIIDTPFGIEAALDHVLLQQGILHLWAVPVEMRFYVLLPIIMALRMFMTSMGGIAVWIFDGLFMVSTYFVTLTQEHVPGENSISLLPYIFAFSVGYICAIFEANKINFFNIKDKFVAYYVPAICIIAIILTTPSIYGFIVSKHISYDYFHDAIIGYAVAWGAVLYICATHSFFLGNIISLPVFQMMGVMSFSFYLWHPFVIGAIERLNWMGDFLCTLMFFLAVFPICMISYNLIEKPFMKLKPIELKW